ASARKAFLDGHYSTQNRSGGDIIRRQLLKLEEAGVKVRPEDAPLLLELFDALVALGEGEGGEKNAG
ncbi:MAG: hypothetical protein ACQET7_16005, partial [Thermodesulfobacteriota bacterium]